MASPPKRYKDPADYSPNEHLEAMRAARRGAAYKVETPEFAEYRNRVLEAGGIESKPDVDDIPLEDLTPEEHLERIRRSRV